MIIGLPSNSPDWRQQTLVEETRVSSDTAPLALCYFRQASVVDTEFLQQLLLMTAVSVKECGKTDIDAIYTNPVTRRYHEQWGHKSHDFGFVAIRQNDNKPLGAAWVRQFSADAPGYSYLANNIPEMVVAVLPQYRNQGIGSQLVARLITHAHKYRCGGLSVSVYDGNDCCGLYDRMGFEKVRTSGRVTTLCHWFGNSASNFNTKS